MCAPTATPLRLRSNRTPRRATGAVSRCAKPAYEEPPPALFAVMRRPKWALLFSLAFCCGKAAYRAASESMDDGELRNKNPPTPCLWQAPASTQKTKRKTRPAIRRSARRRAKEPWVPVRGSRSSASSASKKKSPFFFSALLGSGWVPLRRLGKVHLHSLSTPPLTPPPVSRFFAWLPVGSNSNKTARSSALLI